MISPSLGENISAYEIFNSNFISILPVFFSNMTDIKRDAFRKYLDSNNITEVLNRAMQALSQLDPLPEDPLPFVRECIEAEPMENVDALVRENQDLMARLIQLKQELAIYEGK